VETVLHTFTGGTDGANPYAGVVLDAAGNLYGTTYAGGVANAGVVFKVTPSEQETILYAFTGGTDGANPYAGVVFDASGNLYGTTKNGGAGGFYPAGVVFKLSTTGQETVLYSFTGVTFATFAYPYGGVIFDADGNLYGTASEGGEWGGGGVYKLDSSGTLTLLANFATLKGFSKPESGLVMDSSGNLYGTAQVSDNGTGPGAAFKLTPSGNLSSLYSFPGASNLLAFANGPNGGLALDSSGNVYGASTSGGVSGMIYEVSPSGKETTLYSFAGSLGGTSPGSITRDATGNIYGVTGSGGIGNYGVVYKLNKTGKEAVLYTFTGGTGGCYPTYGPVRDSMGNLYGTASRGGSAPARAGFGVVYKLDTSGNETILHTFTGGADGGYPYAVIIDSTGNLYGTAWFGTYGNGVVYKIDTAGTQTILHAFTGGSDGAIPNSLTLDSAGNLYGTADGGGSSGLGVVFKIDPSGNETVLYSFPINSSGVGQNGNGPQGLTRVSSGSLFGATAAGGSATDAGAGVIFELTADGVFKVLYKFTGGSDGGGPGSAPILGAGGNLYGTTPGGGIANCWAAGGQPDGGCGVVYELSLSGQETVLHTFTGGADGASPIAGLVEDSAGSLYGSSAWGGDGGFSSTAFSGGGVVFSIKPQ